ncbi:hypothetical protein J6590_090455 [Homalodisca vitripennis]|nr:hypothetical protein J6590_090455 [Homalodisca vitripennis]
MSNNGVRQQSGELMVVRVLHLLPNQGVNLYGMLRLIICSFAKYAYYQTFRRASSQREACNEPLLRSDALTFNAQPSESKFAIVAIGPFLTICCIVKP